MNLINILSFLLIFLPIFGVFTDIKSGKIKNYFILFNLIFSIILSFFVVGFYNIENIIGIGVSILFGLFFYFSNKWGAGDGKYIIILSFNLLLLSFLKGFDFNIINYLFLIIFSLLFLYNIFFILFNIYKINFKKLKIKNLDIKEFSFNILFIYSFISLYFFVFNIQSEYNFLVLFISLFFLIPYLSKIFNKYLFIILGFLSLYFLYSFNNYMNIFFIIGFYFFFYFISFYVEEIYSQIDLKNIKIFNIKQGDILNKKSINKIFKETGKKYLETPLQGNEIYEIIGFYKEKNKNILIEIYKDFRIGIIMYIGYFVTIILMLIKKIPF